MDTAAGPVAPNCRIPTQWTTICRCATLTRAVRHPRTTTPRTTLEELTVAVRSPLMDRTRVVAVSMMVKLLAATRHFSSPRTRSLHHRLWMNVVALCRQHYLRGRLLQLERRSSAVLQVVALHSTVSKHLIITPRRRRNQPRRVTMLPVQVRCRTRTQC